MQLACEPASTFPKPCPSTQKGPKPPCSHLINFVSRQGFTDSTNYDTITVENGLGSWLNWQYTAIDIGYR